MNVKNRVALVTGSGSGIGEGIIKTLAANGCRVVVNDLAQEKVDRVVSEIREAGGEAIGIVTDVTNKEQVNAMMDQTVTEFGSIDILVNNAGIARDKSLKKMTEEDWDTVMDINLKSVFLCSQAATHYMREQKHGRIINISSRAWLGWYGQANYSASKGGVVSLTRTLAIELGKYGITANCIAPGLIETPLLKSAPPEVLERLIKAQPTGTIGTSKDIAWGVLYFAGDGSGYVTGQTIFICGGKSLFATPDVR
jgi:NAD(P)-dependent dehydrogenase (short-subunit alcohol dehydrogenase family)